MRSAGTNCGGVLCNARNSEAACFAARSRPSTTQRRPGMTHHANSRTMLWTSFALSTLTILFLLADASVSIFAPHLLADAQAQVGFPSHLSSILAGIMLLCALLFAIPRIATIG